MRIQEILGNACVGQRKLFVLSRTDWHHSTFHEGHCLFVNMLSNFIAVGLRSDTDKHRQLPTRPSPAQSPLAVTLRPSDLLADDWRQEAIILL